MLTVRAETTETPEISPEISSFEFALSRTEQDLAKTMEASKKFSNALARLHKSVSTGNLHDLEKQFETAQKLFEPLKQQLQSSRKAWQFDAETYLESGQYEKDLMEAAHESGLNMIQKDSHVLNCYPSVLKLSPKEQILKIGKKRSKHLRPKVVAQIMKEAQKKPPKLNDNAFLEQLFKAYQRIVKSRGKSIDETNPVVSLKEIYKYMNPLPWQAKEYSEDEFARDLYLLEKSGITATEENYAVDFHASTMAKNLSSTLITASEDGSERIYAGIRFRKK